MKRRHTTVQSSAEQEEPWCSVLDDANEALAMEKELCWSMDCPDPLMWLLALQSMLALKPGSGVSMVRVVSCCQGESTPSIAATYLRPDSTLTNLNAFHRTPIGFRGICRKIQRHLYVLVVFAAALLDVQTPITPVYWMAMGIASLYGGAGP